MGQTLTHKYNTATYIPNIEKYNIQNGRVFNHANEAVAVVPIIEGEQFQPKPAISTIDILTFFCVISVLKTPDSLTNILLNLLKL